MAKFLEARVIESCESCPAGYWHEFEENDMGDCRCSLQHGKVIDHVWYKGEIDADCPLDGVEMHLSNNDLSTFFNFPETLPETREECENLIQRLEFELGEYPDTVEKSKAAFAIKLFKIVSRTRFAFNDAIIK